MGIAFVRPSKSGKTIKNIARKSKPLSLAESKYAMNTKGDHGYEVQRARKVVQGDPESAARLLRGWMKGDLT